jgi:hypothetical protein
MSRYLQLAYFISEPCRVAAVKMVLPVAGRNQRVGKSPKFQQPPRWCDLSPMLRCMNGVEFRMKWGCDYNHHAAIVEVFSQSIMYVSAVILEAWSAGQWVEGTSRFGKRVMSYVASTLRFELGYELSNPWSSPSQQLCLLFSWRHYVSGYWRMLSAHIVIFKMRSIRAH